MTSQKTIEDISLLETREQRLELGMPYAHQTVPNIWPSERVLLQPLVGHNQSATMPVDQLQAIRVARPWPALE